MDISYFESGYIVESYFTRIADSEAGLQSTSTLSATGSKLVTANYYLGHLYKTNEYLNVTNVVVDSQDYSYIGAGGPYGNLTKFDSHGVLQWQVGYSENCYPQFLAIDSSSNLYTVASQSGLVRLIKHDSSGNLLWSRTVNGMSSAQDLRVDASGNPVILGYRNTQPYQIFVQFNSSGSITASRSYTTNTFNNNNLVIDSSNNKYIISNDDTNFRIFKLGSNNTTKAWTKKISLTDAITQARKPTILPDGRVYINTIVRQAPDYAYQHAVLLILPDGSIGGEAPTLNAGSIDSYGLVTTGNGGPIYTFFTTNSNRRVLIVKYNSLGDYAWQRELSYSDATSINDVNGVLDSTGDLLVGVFYSTATGNDAAILKINDQGEGFIDSNGLFTIAQSTYPTPTQGWSSTLANDSVTIATLNLTASDASFNATTSNLSYDEYPIIIGRTIEVSADLSSAVTLSASVDKVKFEIVTEQVTATLSCQINNMTKQGSADLSVSAFELVINIRNRNLLAELDTAVSLSCSAEVVRYVRTTAFLDNQTTLTAVATLVYRITPDALAITSTNTGGASSLDGVSPGLGLTTYDYFGSLKIDAGPLVEV